MWNKKKDEEQPQRQAAVPPAPVQQPQGATSMSMPARFDPPTPVSSSSATIGKAVMVKGQIYSREDLVIDGEVEGTVELQEHRLTVGPNGKVQASVKAREIIVLGTIHGNVDAADKIDIRKDAKLVGDIKAARIVIEDGAYFKGSIDIVKPDVAKQPTATVRPPQAAPQAPMAASATEKH
jgi:cytoskeletal protein CcmA (bactofilin family)